MENKESREEIPLKSDEPSDDEDRQIQNEESKGFLSPNQQWLLEKSRDRLLSMLNDMKEC